VVPEFDTTAQGCRLATSVGGVLTGRGADLIVIDYPLKPEEALSQAQRQAANEMIQPHPLQPPQRQAAGGGPADQAPLHESLPSGVARGRPRRPCAGAGGGEVVRLPALADEAEAYRVETGLGQQSFGRKARRTPSGSCAMTVR
jgi:hypothetical protein